MLAELSRLTGNVYRKSPRRKEDQQPQPSGASVLGAHTCTILLVLYGDKYVGQFGEFVQALQRALPADASVEDAFKTSAGFRVRTGYLAALATEIICFSWEKKIHLGRWSTGRRVNLLQFVQKQRRRTKARLTILNEQKEKRRHRKGDPCLSMSHAREKWCKGERNTKTRYFAPFEGENWLKRKFSVEPGGKFVARNKL